MGFEGRRGQIGGTIELPRRGVADDHEDVEGNSNAVRPDAYRTLHDGSRIKHCRRTAWRTPLASWPYFFLTRSNINGTNGDQTRLCI